MAAVSQKEYLKRYLSGSGDKKKKTKIAKQTHADRCKIVDDDVDLTSLPANPNADAEPERGEDAPLVAEVTDERPAELRVEEEYRKNTKWKTLGAEPDNPDSREGSENGIMFPSSRLGHDSGSDNSPPRVQRHDSDSDSHQSPSRKQRHDSDSDQSPQRIQRQETRVNRDSSTNQSPRRKHGHSSGRDQSPPRRKKHDSGSDLSPPRKTMHSSGDQSPPRRQRHNSDQSPPRRKEPKANKSSQMKRGYSPDSDQSPPRKGKKLVDSSHLPAKKDRRQDRPPSNKGKTRWEPSESSSGKSTRQDITGSSVAESSKEESQNKPERMLEGKRAGLQDGKTLRKESENIRRREMDAFKNIDDELSGRNATTVIRDRATGLKRNLKAEHLLQKAKEAKKVEREEKYMQWGKGLKQQEMQEGRLADDMYEMTKPLARYKDDVDLDRELRQQDRDGDFMLAFIKKKKENASDPNKPAYRGPPPPPNRYGIPPGYRWDGVDRSNGFEAERIARAAEKKASLEDAYKWSVECM